MNAIDLKSGERIYINASGIPNTGTCYITIE